MRKFSCLLVLIFTFCALTVQANESLKLLSRSQDILADPGLTQHEWNWVRQHRTLKLAVWLPMSPPYDITTGLNDYGGINADFLGLIKRSLGIDINVIRYENYQSAREAVITGQADFIAQAGDNQSNDGFILSSPYSINHAVEVINSDERWDKAPSKIAVASTYNSRTVLSHYPHAQLVHFHSVRHAMEALAFRQIDLFYCDEITARYLVSQSNLSNLLIRPPTNSFTTMGFSFATLSQNEIWINVLNKVLKAVPESINVDIHRRWNGGIPLSLSEQKPTYSSLERKWIVEHPNIRVAVSEDNAPIAWFDASGELRGIVAEILAALRSRTGLRFEILRYPNQKEALDAVKDGRAELIAGNTQDDIWRAQLITTRTWLYNSWVMMGRNINGSSSITSSVVSLAGQLPEDWLSRQYTGFVVKVNSWRQGLDRVVSGESDMMTMPLIIANAQSHDKRYASLRILASIDIDPMRYTFGASELYWPLITILNKALINIPPEDLHALTRSGSTGNSFIVTDSSNAFNWPLIAVYVFAVLSSVMAILYRNRQSRHRLCIHMDAIPFPLFVCDEQGVIIQVSKGLCEFLSLSRDHLEGRTLFELLGIHPQFINGEHLHYNNKILRIWRAPGNNGKNSIYMGTDETRQQSFIEKMRIKTRDERKANRAKSEFLITMSHELRTPVSAIIGMLELVMKRINDTQENARSLQVVWDASQSLLLLIGNILDVSRIEMGRLILRPERTPLREFIEAAAMLFDEMANQKGLNFRIEIEADIQGDVLIDRSRLKQILTNLVGNAIKFTESGGVVLRVGLLQKTTSHLQIHFQIEDTGPGIDNSTLKQLFQPFVQGDNSRKMQGSGLGLFICLSLAKMMSGSISLKSQPEKGTRACVTIKVPIMGTAMKLESVDREQTLSGPHKVLVIDDNPAGRMLLAEQLKWLGHQVRGVADLNDVMKSVKNFKPDVIFTDCNMPGKDGFTLASMLITRWPNIVVYGITADAREIVRESARRAGMKDCLFKPVSLVTLTGLLGKVDHVGTSTTTLEGADKFHLPTTLMEGENLRIFLSLQISVIDETRRQLTLWHQNPNIHICEAIHKLRSGIHLLGTGELTALCLEQEQSPSLEGISRLEKEIGELRVTLVRWSETGLQPYRTILQRNEDGSVS